MDSGLELDQGVEVVSVMSPWTLNPRLDGCWGPLAVRENPGGGMVEVAKCVCVCVNCELLFWLL